MALRTFSNLFNFAAGSGQLWDRPQAVTRANLTAARDYVDLLNAEGGTEMVGGIRRALQATHEPGCVQMYVFLTDGYVANDDEILRLVRDERDALKDEVKALKEKADRQKELVRAEGVYFRLTPDKRGLEEAPYCQTCFENEGRLYKMYVAGDLYCCPECARLHRPTAYDGHSVRRMRQDATSRLGETGEGQ